MAVPDFLLPRELSDRAANADAEALDALSRTNPTLHVTVIQNVVMLLLLYAAGIEIGSWMNPRALLSEWQIDLQFWMDQCCGINSAMTVLGGIYTTALLATIAVSIGIIWWSMAWSEGAYFVSVLLVPMAGALIGILYFAIDPRLTAGLQIGLGSAMLVALGQADLRKHQAVAGVGLLVFVVYKVVTGSLSMEQIWSIVAFALLVPLAMAFQVRDVISELMESYLRDDQDQYRLPLLVVHSINIFMALTVAHAAYRLIDRALGIFRATKNEQGA